MTSTEQLLETRKETFTEEIVKEVVESWLAYLKTLSSGQLEQVQALQGSKLVEALSNAYAEARKNEGADVLKNWRMKKAAISAEAEVKKARADAKKVNAVAAFVSALESKDILAADGVGKGGKYLYRNVGDPVTPLLVAEQNEIRGARKEENIVAALTQIFKNNVDAVIEGYVRNNNMIAGDEQIACMSMCDDPDSSLGRNPTWKYAVPLPALTEVPKATIAKELNVPVQQVNLIKPAWSLRTDSGTIGSASIVAFVCTGRANEHVFFTTFPLADGQAFRAYDGLDYRCRWKKLDKQTIEAYFALAKQHDVAP